MTVTLTGTSFISTSTVQWNGVIRPTTFVSSTQLQVQLSTTDLATAGTYQITAVTSGVGTSNAMSFTINNPAPNIDSLVPATITTLSANSTVSINGSGFIATSQVTWNGTVHASTFVNSSQLQVKIAAADVAAVGNASIAVANAAPGGGSSAAASLSVVYPVPTISFLQPSGVLFGSPGFTLTVNGIGFSTGSVVQWNGASRTTTYVNSTALRIAVPASDVANVGTAAITVSTPAPGGGVSSPFTFNISPYPVPNITLLTPSSVVVNSGDTVVSISGSGFVSGSTVQFNGSNLPATFFGSTLLRITVPASNFGTPTTYPVTVTNPAPGGGVSSPATFSVLPNPVPVLNSISPGGAPIGNFAINLQLFGSGFSPNSVVQWNGAARPTTFVSASQLTATIPATDLQALSNNLVTVFNGTPGGGTSSVKPFTTYLPLPTNDLVWDASRGVLWASVPSSAGSTLGNTVVAIDPDTGVLASPIWVGSEPDKLALSDDGTTLWVSLKGTPSVRKVDLANLVTTGVQLYFPGGWGGNVYATDLAVMPGSPSTVAVAAGSVSIFDDATPRSKTGINGATYLAFGATSGTLYGWGSGFPCCLSIFSVDSTGIASTNNPPSSGTFSNDLRYDNGRLYLTSGGVLDGTNGGLLGTFAASGPVAPDSTVGRAFVLNSSQSFGTANQITAFDLNTFVPVGSLPLGGVQTNFSTPSLIRWGADGLAFRTDMQQVYILRSTLVRDLSASPADVAVSIGAPASSTTGTNTSITITLTNNGPNKALNVSLIDTTSANAIFVSASPSQGVCAGFPVLRCNFGSLSSGASATLTLLVLPTSAGTLTNTATAAATPFDPVDTNNTASSTTSVSGSDYNSVPALLSLTPQSAAAGASTLTLTVKGASFASASTVNWNGTSLPTTFVNSNQLSATVDASFLSAAGFADVTVNTGTPGGGVSGALPFTVFQTVALDTNDVVFDPFTRKLYASLPSTATQLTGNSIVSIDPLTGTLGTPVNIGSEPTRMAISDDGKYLYVVLAGSKAVRRMDLPALAAGTQFTTSSSFFGAFTASDLAVMPGNHDVLATAGYANGIQVWDVGSTGVTGRTATSGNGIYEGSVLAWGDSTNLYSNDEGLSPSSFHRFAVGPTSFAESDSTYLDAVGGKITYSAGLIYSDGGGVVDPSPIPPVTPRLVGRFMNTIGGGSSAADGTINRVFFLSPNSYAVNSRIISAFDASRFTLLNTTQLDGLTGDAFDLTRWGSDGLAFRTAKDFWGSGSGRVILLHGPTVLPRSANNPVPSPSTASPNSVTAGTGNTWVTITGSQFLPGAVVLWNGGERTTTFINSSQLKVAISASDLAASDTVSITVKNPGSNASTAITFTIN